MDTVDHLQVYPYNLDAYNTCVVDENKKINDNFDACQVLPTMTK